MIICPRHRSGHFGGGAVDSQALRLKVTKLNETGN